MYRSMQNIDKSRYPYSGNVSRVFTNFAISVQFVKVLTAKVFIELVASLSIDVSLSFPQFVKVLIAKIQLSAIREGFHQRNIPAILLTVYI